MTFSGIGLEWGGRQWHPGTIVDTVRRGASLRWPNRCIGPVDGVYLYCFVTKKDASACIVDGADEGD
eukprot:11881152-Ditylum_brightwellii.AAC.1